MPADEPQLKLDLGLEQSPEGAPTPPTSSRSRKAPRPNAVEAADAAPSDPELLFGVRSPDAIRIVAVEVAGETAVLFRREDPDPGALGRIHRHTEPFTPWLLATQQAPLAGARWRELEGEGHRWLAEFSTWEAFLAARAALRDDRIPAIAYSSPVRQHLMRTRRTLFQGMEFGEVHRLQIDLETASLDPQAPEARVLLVALSDNAGGEWVLADEDEAALIHALVTHMQSLDPDVIEGHHLFGFDLPYLAARAERLGIPLALGRDGSPLTLGRERRCPIGANSRPFKPAYIWGRHCVDTLLGVQRFDVGRGELEAHGLKEVTAHYGLSAPDRILLDRRLILDLWRSDPDRVREYARQDVTETRRLAELVFPTEFYQAQMLPDSYQQLCTIGTGEKINLLMVREYLRRGWAIPLPETPRAFPGGYTEVRRTGVLRRVVKVDAESLYPSLMLAHEIRPASDRLNVFLPMLRELTRRRLEAKAKMRQAGGAERAYWDGLQGSFKILINSFFGYLGGPFPFNDMDAAERVTVTAQEIVKQMARLLEENGNQVIEVDTDGVYFVPPPEVASEEQELAYVAQLERALPEGIRLAHDGRYQAMISLKTKNYVLLGYDGKKIFRGASLRSRADERYGRDFVARAVDYLIAGDLDGLRTCYLDLCDRIARGALDISEISRRERVTEKTFRSEARRRSRALAEGVAIGDWITVYERRDGSLALADDYVGDEDRWYYLEKLYKFAGRLREAVGGEFDRVFPPPSRRLLQAQQAGQAMLF
ncbi:MAG: DNA polymerase [Armatimonadetes bacterium]|nr:DNA polymerase [Armatimonadota bacterium]